MDKGLASEIQIQGFNDLNLHDRGRDDWDLDDESPNDKDESLDEELELDEDCDGNLCKDLYHPT